MTVDMGFRHSGIGGASFKGHAGFMKELAVHDDNRGREPQLTAGEGLSNDGRQSVGRRAHPTPPPERRPSVRTVLGSQTERGPLHYCIVEAGFASDAPGLPMPTRGNACQADFRLRPHHVPGLPTGIVASLGRPWREVKTRWVCRFSGRRERASAGVFGVSECPGRVLCCRNDAPSACRVPPEVSPPFCG